MGLGALDAALSGLRVSQQQLDVISNNIANVSTPGYTRKILPQSAQSIAGETVGVRAGIITRNVDLNLSRDFWTQISATEFLNVQAEYLKRVEQFHGPPDAELSVSAEVSRLYESFVELANSPEDTFFQASVIDQAEDTANKINDLSNLITTSRNDIQDEIFTSVSRINDLLSQIADLNDEISNSLSTGRSVAASSDDRDSAIQELSSLIQIDFFTRSDGVMVVQTVEGLELASETAEPVSFSQTPVSATTFYPDSINGIIVGEPNTPSAVDITQSLVGAKLGGLIQLRDETFPKQMAQLDELAHKLALRFEDQGLLLFTDPSGLIPDDGAPTAEDPGPPVVAAVPVDYVGFSASIQVNQNILDDPSLLQRGTVTTDETVQAGSSEVIQRIIEYTFSDIEFQIAEGNFDLRASAVLPVPIDLQNLLGLFSRNEVEGSTGLSGYPTMADLLNVAGPASDNPLLGTDDQFSIVFSDPRIIPATADFTVTIDLDAVADTGNAAQSIVDEINAQITAGAPANDPFAASASVGPNGEIVLNSRANIQIDNTIANGLSSQGLSMLGFVAGTTTTTDPSFDVQVGNDDPVTITIEPGDDENDLVEKLRLDTAITPGDTDGVPGLGVSIDPATGFLTLRPGDSTDPALATFGGGLKITGSNFQADPALADAASPLITAGVPGPINIVTALFGSLDASNNEISPISNTAYGSITDGAAGGPPFPELPFREDLLGPNADISTGVVSARTLVDFSQKMVNQHILELNLNQTRIADEETYLSTLETQLLDESGVNLDQELSTLIVVQTAYSASARIVSAVDQLFQELLNAV